MHQTPTLNWPTADDLYPHVGMSSAWPAECVPPAKTPAASLPAPAAEQGGRATWYPYAFAMQLTSPSGFWHSSCQSLSMRRFDGAYRA